MKNQKSELIDQDTDSVLLSAKDSTKSFICKMTETEKERFPA